MGSDDFKIRAFKNEDLLFELSETAKITLLEPIMQAKFAFALQNGAVGVYDGKRRLWGTKGKHKVTALLGYYQEEVNLMCVLVGFANGKLAIQAASTGETMYSLQVGGGIAKILNCDYKLEGKKHIICCTTEGEGFLLAIIPLILTSLVSGYILKHQDLSQVDIKKADPTIQNAAIKELVLRKNVPAFFPNTCKSFPELTADRN